MKTFPSWQEAVRLRGCGAAGAAPAGTSSTAAVPPAQRPSPARTGAEIQKAAVENPQEVSAQSRRAAGWDGAAGWFCVGISLDGHALALSLL